MVLVDKAYRGQGLGKATFRACLEEARGLGVGVLGLDATEMGEPIYGRYGFKVTQPVTRWGGVLQLDRLLGHDRFERAVCKGLNDSILEFDARLAGVDRSSLLRALADTDGRCYSLREGGVTQGYAFVRLGRNAFHIGPMVTESSDQMSFLLRVIGEDIKGEEVICDALSTESEALLSQSGLKPLRVLKRMAVPDLNGLFCHESLRLGAGFEWG